MQGTDMPINRHTAIYNISRRRSLRDSVGILIEGELVYHNVKYWIEKDPERLWDAVYDKVHKVSLNKDAYECLRIRMSHVNPEKVGALLKKKYNHCLLRKIRSKTGDPNAQIKDPNYE